jgi:hypothetical protein
VRIASQRELHPDAALAPANLRVRASRGQALLVLIVMMSIATVLLVYGSTTEVSRIVRADARTRLVLEEAREALIGRALADANRPGSLPCPDNDDDGSADLFTGSACPSYLGRLPWRTLGIGDLRDAAGERLWYALSPGFRDHPFAPALNSDTRGTLEVYSNNKMRLVTSQGVAVVFAPGTALPGQRRDASLTFCASTAKNVQRAWCAANYLDTAAKVNNAAAAGPYIAAAAGEFNNDRLAIIVTADLMPLVERRVVLETRNALLAYRSASACACYPWADSGNDGTSDVGAHQGRIPTMGALPQPWASGVLPSYLAANGWSRLIYYAVARDALEDAGKSCATCTEASLTLDGQAGYDVMLISPGYAAGSALRTSWGDYIDDAENRNGDHRFVTPVSSNPDRDRAYPIAGRATGCAVNARVLIDNVPCRGSANSVRAVCQSTSAALASCKCASAAQTMVKAPCADTLISQQCDLAILQLRECTL